MSESDGKYLLTKIRETNTKLQRQVKNLQTSHSKIINEKRSLELQLKKYRNEDFVTIDRKLYIALIRLRTLIEEDAKLEKPKD